MEEPRAGGEENIALVPQVSGKKDVRSDLTGVKSVMSVARVMCCKRTLCRVFTIRRTHMRWGRSHMISSTSRTGQRHGKLSIPTVSSTLCYLTSPFTRDM